MQSLLFDNDEPQYISLKDGGLVYYPRWLYRGQDGQDDFANADNALFNLLNTSIAWEQSTISLYGKNVTIPRLNAWYGDYDCYYNYSGTDFIPQPWLPSLLAVKKDIEETLSKYLNGKIFNSALLNKYRDGEDSVAWHSDDEPELGQKPVIASLSLGANRYFELKHKFDKNQKKLKLLLGDGDLLLMMGATQGYWQHQVPKMPHIDEARISVTLRTIVPK